MSKLSDDIKAQKRRFKYLCSTGLPNKIIRLATELIDDSFRKERYQASGSQKWATRKGDAETALVGNRRKVARDKRRALLVQSGKLIGSPEFFRRGSEVVIATDVVYAKRHNEGESGMPQRQFMPIQGEPFPKESEIDKYMDEQLSKIFP